MTTKFEFTPAIQEKILAMMLFAPDDSISHIQSEHFDHPALQLMAALILNHYRRYNTFITAAEFDDAWAKAIDKPRIPQEEYMAVYERVLALGAEDFAYIKDKTVEFAKAQALRNAVVKAAETLAKHRDPESILADIQQALSIGGAARPDDWAVEAVCAADIQEEQIQWLWRGAFPFAMLSVIMGPPGMGKSYFTTMIAARVSRGAAWPVATAPAPTQGHVLILQAEDDLKTTCKRRLRHEEADQRFIHFISAMRGPADRRRGIDLTSDVERVRRLIHEIGDVRLLIVDPLSAYVGISAGMDSHKDRDVRLALQPLEILLAEERIAIIGVMHLNKNQMSDAIYRISGSAAWAQVPRMIWAITARKDDTELKEFLNAKHGPIPDIEAMAQQFCFRISHDTNRITAAENEQPGDVREALAPSTPEDAGERRSKVKMAITILEDLRAAGEKEVPASEFEDLGISAKTWQVARERLGIEPRRDHSSGKWYWCLG